MFVFRCKEIPEFSDDTWCHHQSISMDHLHIVFLQRSCSLWHHGLGSALSDTRGRLWEFCRWVPHWTSFSGLYTVSKIAFHGEKEWFNFVLYTDVYIALYVQCFLSVCEKNSGDSGGIRTHDLLLTSADILTSRPPSLPDDDWPDHKAIHNISAK